MKKLSILMTFVMVFALFSSILVAAATAETTDISDSKELWVGISSEPVDLDPSRVLDYNSFLVSSQIYETLVSYQPGGSIAEPGGPTTIGRDAVSTCSCSSTPGNTCTTSIAMARSG